MDIGTLPPGSLLGVSPWQMIDQDMINRFADLTMDHQFIHVDPVRAAASPLGGTVAHGFLTLSLASHLIAQAVPGLQDGITGSLNYGLDRLRFLNPVRAGSRVRGRFTLTGVEQRGDGARLLRVGVEIEIEGADRPAMAADWLIMQMLD